jgi:hypothetical protein
LTKQTKCIHCYVPNWMENCATIERPSEENGIEELDWKCNHKWIESFVVILPHWPEPDPWFFLDFCCVRISIFLFNQVCWLLSTLQEWSGCVCFYTFWWCCRPVRTKVESLVCHKVFCMFYVCLCCLCKICDKEQHFDFVSWCCWCNTPGQWKEFVNELSFQRECFKIVSFGFKEQQKFWTWRKKSLHSAISNHSQHFKILGT